MSRDPISELTDGLLKLGALQFRICSMISEAVLAPSTASEDAAADVPLRTFSEEEVEAAALARIRLRRRLLMRPDEDGQVPKSDRYPAPLVPFKKYHLRHTRGNCTAPLLPPDCATSG
jgi:hypothetical protein